MFRTLGRTSHIRMVVLVLVGMAGSSTAAEAGDVHQALADGMTDEAIALLKKNPALIESRDDREMTPLHYAVEQRNLKAVKWLLSRKANVNAIDHGKFTPLYFASDRQMAEALIKAGANLDLKDCLDMTPLLHAAEEKRQGVVDAILATGYKLDLKTALVLKKRDVVKKLLNDDPKLAKQPSPEWDLNGCHTPLGIACAQRDSEIAELLLKSGADVNEQTYMPNAGCNVSALTNAVWVGDAVLVQLLLKYGAKTDTGGGKRERTLLDYARKNSSPEIVALLEKAAK